MRVDEGDDLSVPLRFGELSMHSSNPKVEDDVAILTANVQMCPNVGAVFLMSELDSDEDDKKLSTQSTNCCELIHGCDTRA